MSSYSTLGPRGENNIIKKVPVTSDYGSMIFDSVVASHDWTDVSKRLLKTLEFSNTTPLPAKIYANEGAAQFLFFEGVETCEKSYADRKGKYMHQTGVTLPKL